MAYYLHLYQKTIKQNVMKKLVFILSSLFLTIGFCLISVNSNSQDIQLSRQERKDARKAQMLDNFNAIDALLEQKSFLLKAEYLQNQFGSRIPVISTLNFIQVDSTNVILQTGSNTFTGNNGVGGVTAEGSLNRWKLVKNVKHLNFYVQFSVVTGIGVYDVSMTVNASNIAQATITGLRSGKLVYDGHLATAGNSRIYKGQNSY